MVSRGYWNSFVLHDSRFEYLSLVSYRSGKRQEIALKELLFGFEDFGVDLLTEFLVEIKYMR